MDKLTKEQRRKNMQAVKSTGSKIETALAKALWAKGFRYRKNNKTVFGKPDFTLKNIRRQFSLTANFGTAEIGKFASTIIKAIRIFG